MRVENLTPVVAAAPGERATCRLRIENTERGSIVYALRVVGFDEGQVLRPPSNGPLEPGAAEEVDLEFVIPDAFAAGNHSVAVEVTPDRPGAAPVIAAVTVAVGSIDAVALAVQPSTIRGHRRGKFRVDIDNRSADQMDVELAGEGPDLQVMLRPDRIRLRPGDRVHTSGRVKAPRHLVGEPRQHSLTVTARSRSAPSYAPATFQQRPLFPRSLRTLLVLLAVVGLWAGALGAGYYWWTTRDDEQAAEPDVELVDTDGDGVPETPADQLVDTNGDGRPDKLAAVVAEEVAQGRVGEPQPGGSDLPTHTVIGGTVKAGETGNDADVAVTLTPIELGAKPPAGAAFVGGTGESRGAVKVWPARAFIDDSPGLARARQTVSVDSRNSGPDGAWLFSAVPIRQNYEVNLAKPGFDSQSFVVTPRADGSPVELEVVLEPASGTLSGSAFGPNGPLGNVDLVLTDGTLTFNTTTASGDGAGAWELTGISTPGTYTLTATLNGFGTEVLQIPLEPGEQRTGVNITMTPGVGSILGRVTSGPDRLGGVTLTTSNGEDTLTTTSLTEGDTGLYSFPRLDIPGRYTITASRDGYVTQTRLVTLDGNATGVNFDMVRTTATIKGVVTSVGRNGRSRGPLSGVSITVRRDDLLFNTTSSSSERDPGSFRISDLPPGDYVVEFFDHQHDEASQLVSVAAGEDRDLGEVPLRFIGRPREPNTGTLTVDVTDSRGEPLPGATVALYDVGDEDLSTPIHKIPGRTQTSFRFPESEKTLEVGTYQVVVTHEPLYNVVVRTKSVGLEDEEMEVALFRRGQVRGQLVNSHNGQPLDNYELRIVPLDSAGNPDPERATRDVAVGPRDPDPRTGEILWEVDPDQPLAAGDYELRVPGPTRGFRFTRRQVLQQGQAPMRFEIPADNENPITLNDLELDPLPILRGRVVAPRLDDPNDVSFDDINVNLDVDFHCPPRPPNPVVGAEEQNRDGLDGDDFYVLDRTLVSDALVRRVDASCVLTVTDTSGQYLPATVPVTVRPSRDPADAVIVLNIALFEPSDIGGRVYWVDRGASSRREVPVEGAEVRTQGVVITGFNPGVGGDPTPDPADTDLTATSNDEGAWVFGRPRQVFGRATYRFSVDSRPDPPEFEPRSITITIDEEDGRTVAAVGTSQPPLALDNGTGSGNNIGVELEANGGPIVGQVELFTIKGTDAFPDSTANLGGFSMTLDRGPASTPFARVSGSPPTGRASVSTDDPGTYEASVTAPNANHVLRRGQPAPTGMTLLQEPGQRAKESDPVEEPPESLVSFSRQFVELGHIDVRVFDAMDPQNPLADAVVDVTDQPRGDVDENGEASFPRLAVDHGNPTGNPLPYAVTPVIEGFDLSAASFILDTETEGLDPDDPTPGDVVCAPPTDCSTAGLGIVAGGQQTVTFSIPEYGSISGRVLGQTRSPADRVALRIDEGLTVTARRITDAAGNFLPSPETVPAGDIELDLDDPAEPRFRFSGLPGKYTITVAHSAYEATPIAEPPAETITHPTTGETFAVYEMTNLTPDTPSPNDLADPWVLQAERGSLDITVHQDTLAGIGVLAATIELCDRATDPCTPVDLGTNDETDADGRLVVPNLIAGNYRLEIRKQDADGDLFFPVIATVNVPEGDSPEARTRVVRAPLPRIGGAIVGTVGAINSEGNRLLDRLPVPAGIVVSREYTGGPSIVVANDPSIPGTTATVPNEATEGDLSLPPAPTDPPPTSPPTTGPPTTPPASPPTTGPPTSPPTTEPPPARTRPRVSVRVPANATGTPQEYRFEGVASGVHRLAFSDVDGFTTPTVQPPTVLGIATTNVDQVDYVAANRTIVVNVTKEGLPVGDATVRLTHPDGDNRIPTVSNGVYTFSGVPPEVEAYTLVVTKPLHRVTAPPEPISVPVPAGDGDLPEIDVTLAANAATISGVARKQTAPGETSPLTNGSVELIKLPAATPVDTEPPNASGNYTFTVNEAGDYRVRVLGPPPSAGPPVEPGYATRESTSFTVTLGQAVTTPTVPTVIVPRLATFSITVNGPEPDAITVTPIIAPTTPPAHPPAQSRSDRTFTVRVDPDYSYRFRLSSPFFLTETVPTNPVNPDPGETGSARLTITETLAPRTVSGRVTTGTPAAGVAGATVRATRATLTRNATTSDGPPPANSPPVGAYSMSQFDEGTWAFVAEKLGVGRNTRDVAIPADSASITGADVTLLPRLVDVSFTVAGGGNAASITLLDDDGNTVDSGTTTNGAVTLEAREHLFPLDWRATMSPRIPKTGQVSISGLTGTFNLETLAVTVPQITLDLPTLTGTVSRPDGSDANNTTVFACAGATGTCDANTTGVVSDQTNADGEFSLQPTASGTWRVRAVRATESTSGFRTFTVSAVGVLNPTTVALQLVAPPTPP